MDLGKYKKFLVAASGALATIALVSEGGVSTLEWIQVAIAALAAAGVYQIPNSSSRSQ